MSKLQTPLVREEQSFEYVVKRQRRKTIAVHVLADATVEVRAPNWLPNHEVINFVEQRSEWIVAQRQNSLQKQQAVPGYYHGQQHLFLGQNYPLSTRQQSRTQVDFFESNNFDEASNGWMIGLPDPDNPERIKKALEQWYRQQAQAIFDRQMILCFSRFPAWFQLQYQLPEITIRKMRRRWGSCSSKGAVTLNLLLMRMPLSCIDYVIVHELCHLQEFHHGKEFYQLLASVMPDWRERERQIEQQSLCT